MTFLATDYYCYIDSGVVQSGPVKRSQLTQYGEGDTGPFTDDGWYQLWVDDPGSPGRFYDQVPGDIVVVPDVRCEQTIAYQEWESQRKRDVFSAEIQIQVPIITLTDSAQDKTAQAKIDQLVLRAAAAQLDLSRTADEDLDTFDTTLETHQIQEPDYAKNIALQETENLSVNEGLIAAGNGGIYEVTEVQDMEARIVWNARVSRGEETGVQVPERGAPRSDSALDAEETNDSTFEEVSFNWSAQDYFIPKVTLFDVPAGVDMGQVYCMCYDANNTYLSWMPFAEESPGVWVTPSDVNYIAIAKTASSTWRVAVAAGGTQSEYEITRRVYLVPPNTSTSIVRWGGSNGAAPQVFNQPKGKKP